jgi:hypothetical protein
MAGMATACKKAEDQFVLLVELETNVSSLEEAEDGLSEDVRDAWPGRRRPCTPFAP